MKKLLLFIAAAVIAASAAFAQYPVSDDEPVVPDIDPVPDGITIAVYVPEGIDNYRAPLWTGNTNPIPWAGEEMVAVEGAEGWYKVDINATSVQGIPLCQPEGWTEEKGINYWHLAKISDCRILQSSNFSYFEGDGFLVVDGTGLVALQVKSWPAVPYEPKRDFTFYVQVPECTPEIQESINIAGSMPGDDGNLWLEGTTFPIVDGVATVTISGFETDEWKVRLTDDWSQQAVECSNGRIWVWNNQVLGEAEGQVIVVEGWGEVYAIGDCLSDCKPLILSTNNFNLYPGESVKVSLEYKDSPVDATAAVWISNDPEVFTIDETGLITGVATGQGTFTVIYDGLSATGYVYYRAGYRTCA